MEAEFALVALAQRLVTAGLNLSAAVLVGASAAHIWLLGARSAWGAGLLPRLARTMRIALAAALPAHVALLWLEAASMAEVPVRAAFPALRSVITATHYGAAWMVGAAAMVIVALTLRRQEGKRAGMAAALCRAAALGVLLYSRSTVSHAGAGGDFGWAVLADWVHLLAVSLWVGVVVVAGFVILRRMPEREAQDRADCARCVAALSTAATAALAAIAVTGILGAWRTLESVDQIFGSPYGNTLLLKVGLVLCAAALGGANRFIVMPGLLARLRQSGPAGKAARSFALVLQLEACILVAALVVAAFLSSTSPPGAM